MVLGPFSSFGIWMKFFAFAWIYGLPIIKFMEEFMRNILHLIFVGLNEIFSVYGALRIDFYVKQT